MALPLAAPAVSRKSTNVRSNAERMHARLRTFFSTVGPFAPGLAGAIGERLFLTAPPTRSSPRIEAALARATAFTVRHHGARLAAWSWGEGPAVLLVHGWGGRGGQLAAFVDPLVRGGRRVVAFDAPAHGESEGRRSSMPQFADAIEAMAAHVGGIDGLIAHSMGAASATIALSRTLRARSAVFVGAASDPASATLRFAEALGMPRSARDVMQGRMERRFGRRFEEIYVPRLAMDMRTHLLLMHDRDDREVPWEEGVSIAAAWPGARLRTTHGLGHRRILQDASVIAEAAAFLLEARPDFRAA